MDDMADRCFQVMAIRRTAAGGLSGALGVAIVGVDGSILAVECGTSDIGEPYVTARTIGAQVPRTPVVVDLGGQVLIQP